MRQGAGSRVRAIALTLVLGPLGLAAPAVRAAPGSATAAAPGPATILPLSRVGDHPPHSLGGAWRLTAATVTATVALTGRFEPLENRIAVLGRRKGAVWLRFDLLNDLGRSEERLLTIGWPRLAEVHGWALRGSGALQPLGRSGWAVAWSDRALAHPGHAFPLSIEPGEVVTVLVRIRTPTEVILPVDLHTWPQAIRFAFIGAAFVAAYCGLVFGLALYNALVFLRVRRRYHLLYAASVGCFLPWWLLNSGWLGWVPGLNDATVIYAVSALLVGAWQLFRLELTRSLLGLDRVAPRLDALLRTVARAWVPLLVVFSLILSDASVERIGATSDSVLVGLTVYAGYVALRAGVGIARWFLPASGLLLAGLVLGQAIFTGLVVSPLFAGLSIMGGTLAEAFVLTMALAERSRADAASRELLMRQAVAHRLGSLEALVAGVVHELNNPLGTLRSAADSLGRIGRKLADGLFGERDVRVERALGVLPKVVSSAQQAAFRIEAVVKALESFARLDRPDKDTVDLSVGLRSALVLLNAKVPRGVEVQVDLPSLPPIRCRPAEINQAFAAVVDNALEAMPSGGVLEVTAHAEPTWLVIRVRDTGIGIPSEERARVFEPRLVRKGRRVKMGMGLSIARSVVEGHGGIVTLESQVGRGTAVELRIPRATTRRAGLERPTSEPGR